MVECLLFVSGRFSAWGIFNNSNYYGCWIPTGYHEGKTGCYIEGTNFRTAAARLPRSREFLLFDLHTRSRNSTV